MPGEASAGGPPVAARHEIRGVPEIEGDMPFFGGTTVSRTLSRRVLGPLRFVWLGVVLVGMACGGAFGGWAAAYGDDLPGWVMILAVAAFAAAVVGALVTAHRAIRGAARRRWHTRGVPETAHLVVRLADAALLIEVETAITRVPWRYVSEIVRDGQHLIFIVAGMGHFVPRRFFVSPADENAFVTAALAKLGPDARARSAAAANRS